MKTIIKNIMVLTTHWTRLVFFCALTFLLILIVTSSSKATNYNNYATTLDKLHAENSTKYPLPAYTSAYEKIGGKSSIFFDVLDENASDYLFTYITADSDNNLTKSYYGFDYKIKNGVTSESRSIRVTIPNGIEASYYNLNNGIIDPNDVKIYDASGGAIFNYNGTLIGNITGDFVANHIESSLTFLSNGVYSADGGAIYNNWNSRIGNITGDFIGNYVKITLSSLAAGDSAGAVGGAIVNRDNSNIGNITGNFIANYSESTVSQAFGGAIFNTTAYIKDITGDFIANHAKGKAGVYGGAIYNNYGGTYGNITGNFINNYIETYQDGGAGGAIFMGSHTNEIGIIDGNFINNYATGETTSNTTSYVYGGAVFNTGIIKAIWGNFIANYVHATSAYGGAISNDPNGNILEIKGNFINNFTYADTNVSIGGAIFNKGSIKISGSFFNNHAQTSSATAYALGGAIYTTSNITFVANKQDNFFSDNYTIDKRNTGDKIYNAIFVETSASTNPTLTFNITNKGNFIFNDNINGGYHPGWGEIQYDNQYNLSITGDNYESSRFFMNNDIINAGNVSVNDAMLIFGEADYGKGVFIADPNNPNKAAITNLTLTNGQFYLHNNYFETVKLNNYTAAGNDFLHINVGHNGTKWVSDMLNINGSVNGQTKLVIYDVNKNDNTGASVLFVEAPNDSIKNRDAFEVYRVYGSPYMWEVKYNYGGETTGSYWYLVNEANEENEYTEVTPDPIIPSSPPTLPGLPNNPGTSGDIEVNPEVIAYRGLHAASIEQTRSMVNNIRSKVAANKVLPDTCLLVKDEAFDGDKLYNAWVNPIYHTANIDAPVEIEADIWGVEAGFDIQANQNHKIGAFASYRQGEYDLNGKGKKYYSDKGSKIDIDSYIGGLYYRYDYRHLWVFATAYGGVQKADIKTDDGAKADTDGTQLGASIETGYLFNLSNTLKLEPSFGVFYTQVDFDDVKDNFGISADYKTIRQTEVELGVKLEKYLPLDNGMAKIYIKPSVVQVITSGDSVAITGLGKMSTYDDGTLGRIELGGRYAITDALSTYGYVNYTFGSDYDATSLGVGLNYSW